MIDSDEIQVCVNAEYSLECCICGSVEVETEDDLTTLGYFKERQQDMAKKFHEYGWRNIDSLVHAISGVCCPKCLKDEVENIDEVMD